ncbi:hypothetical protein SEUCBS140593_010381 [Sporothrix eucalyptigena]|uniref:Tpr domain containing protein n=1 Tax=Sporothrix eucalyptigena TaxID=1812306 RepID=A0ABP0D2Y2_9PEZI
MALSKPVSVANTYFQKRLLGQLAQSSPALSVSRQSWLCLQQTSSSGLQLHIRLQLSQSRNASSGSHLMITRAMQSHKFTVTLTVGALQTRRQSTIPRNDGNGEDAHGRPPPPPPPRGRVPIFRMLIRAIGGSFRSLFTPFQGQTLRTLFRSNPEELVLALAVLIASVFVIAYVARIYFSYFYSRQFTRYPPSVAKYLRRALYFSNYSPDPKRALKNYKLALEQCDALGLDPFSDDVLGIRIQLASWLEQIRNYDAAIKILELLLADCKRWVDLMEKDVKDGVAGSSLGGGGNGLSPRLPPPLLTGKMKKPVATIEGGEAAEEEIPQAESETIWGRRSRILRKAIGISVKLGELYADEHILNADLAHDRLVWSVDTALQEFKRRSVEGLKDGEGEWMSPLEMGAALESLGHSYESRSQFHLALPLFFQALRVCSDPCHSAVIMNNLAISFAQHPVQPPYETLVGSVIDKPASGSSSAPPITKEEAQRAYYETAQRWAQNAHQHATDTAGDARTPECDHACAVALCNLGDIAALLGDVREATWRFQEARAMSKAMEFDAGIHQAEVGLARLPKQ